MCLWRQLDETPKKSVSVHRKPTLPKSGIEFEMELPHVGNGESCKYCFVPMQVLNIWLFRVPLHTEKGKHEENCEFRPYSCPCPRISCKWQGSLEQVVPHLDMSHASVVTLQGEDITFVATNVNLSEAMDWAMIQSCFGHHFLLVLQKYRKFLVGQQHFFAIVQLIRSRKEAEKFSYKLELKGQRRRLTWQATPRSIREVVSFAIMKTDGLFLDNNTAQHFIDNGNLVIEVTISMVSD